MSSSLPATVVHPNKQSTFYSVKAVAIAALVSGIYLGISLVLVGYKSDELLLLALFNALYFISPATRRFVIAFSVFFIYWIIFDWMKAFPNYRYNAVHIESLYQFEKSAFGFSSGGATVTPNEYFALHHRPWLDLLTGFFYLCWVPVPLAFAAVLFVKSKRWFFPFAITFFVVNLIGFAVYYLYPAAPPWYVANHGFSFIANTPGNTAGLHRFDSLTSGALFKSIYAKSSNVFAAMPSLHAAYMVIVLFFGLKMRLRWWNLLFAVIMMGIWFTAVYSSHHYIADVLAGIACAAAGIAVVNWWRGTAGGRKAINHLVSATTAKEKAHR